MAYKITEDCLACGVCEPECPEGAITPGEGDAGIYKIDAGICTDCASCSEVCPVDACVPISG